MLWIGVNTKPFGYMIKMERSCKQLPLPQSQKTCLWPWRLSTVHEMLTLVLSPASLIQSYFYLLHSDNWMHFLFKGTGQSYYSKSKSVLKCSLYLKNQTLNKISSLSLVPRAHTGVSVLWATNQMQTVWKDRLPFSHHQLTMAFASSQNAAQALHHHCNISKWDLVQNPGSHT